MLEICMVKFDKFFEQLFINSGITNSFAHFINLLILSGIIALIAVIVNFIAKKIIIRIIKHWVDRSKNDYDDVFYEKGVFNKLSHLAPALTISYLAPVPFAEYPKLLNFVTMGANIYMLVVIILVISSIINALQDIYHTTPNAKNRSIKGYVQVAKSIVFFIGALMIISILVKKDLSSLFAGLTAFAAVLMFVFKDAILGLIAGIQMSSNDILRMGDYIEMPSRNVDGTVIDITLNTVKVHNANKTISTVPSYAFVSESFQNWRGIELADGRRIKRFINIDVTTIKYCDEKLIKKLREVELLKPFFEEKDAELLNHNTDLALWNGKLYTNATLYRAYVEAYLKSNPYIDTKATLMVRHLQPTEHGLPIEIYAYSNEKNGPKHEALQSNIFDHIIAIVPEFKLKIFQKPTGFDLKND
jgi:miniconductance mechanosensitive channel